MTLYKIFHCNLNEFEVGSWKGVAKTTLKLPQKASLESNRIIEACKRDNHAAGRGPTGIAAAAVYLAAMLVNQPRTQREVAMAAGVTEVTIRNRYKEMCATMKLNPDNPAGNN